MRVSKSFAAILPAMDAMEDSESEFGPNGGFISILSTASKDRDGDELDQSQWKLPLPARINLDMDHEMSVAGTIGSAIPFFNENGDLAIKASFASTELGQTARTLVKEGHIDSVSVAFMTDPDAPADKNRELLNAALVAIPANRDAKILAAKSVVKAGARNNKMDQASLQSMHDILCGLGVKCMKEADDAETDSTDDEVVEEKAATKDEDGDGTCAVKESDDSVETDSAETSDEEDEQEDEDDEQKSKSFDADVWDFQSRLTMLEIADIAARIK